MLNFNMVYQPQYHDGFVIGMEALIRPDNVLDIESFVKNYHDPIELDLMVISRVLMETKKVKCRVSINLSYFSLVSKRFIDYCIDNVSPIRIMFELTEYNEIIDISKIKENIIKLQNNGFFISLDDFGRGSSNINIMSDVFFDQVKFDRSLMVDIEVDFNKYKKLRVLNEQVKSFGITNIVYEGVENQRQEMLIKMFDVDPVIQGYLYTPPVKIDEITNHKYQYKKLNDTKTVKEDMEELVYNLIVSNCDLLWNNKIQEYDFFNKVYDKDPKKTIINYKSVYLSQNVNQYSINVLYSMMNHSDKMIVIRNLDGIVVFENKKHEDFFGRSLVGVSKKEIISQFEIYKICLEDDRLLLMSDEKFSIKKETYNGDTFFTIRQKVIFNDDCFVFVTAYEEEKGFFVSKDILTGCLNRDALIKIKRRGRFNNKVVAFIDLNGFKSINDMFGHDTGDVVLRDFSEILHNNLRVSSKNGDVIIRHGGDEFLIFFNATDLHKIDQKLSMVNNLVSEFFLSKNIMLSFSYGLSINENNNVDLAITNADVNMYVMKNRYKIKF